MNFSWDFFFFWERLFWFFLRLLVDGGVILFSFDIFLQEHGAVDLEWPEIREIEKELLQNFYREQKFWETWYR